MPNPAIQTDSNQISVTGDYRERAWMVEVHDGMDTHRNAVIVAHRRGGKTVGVVAQTIRDYYRCKHANPQIAYIAPTAKQARSVAWGYYVGMLEAIPGITYRRHELTIEMPPRYAGEQGGRIIFASGESYERLRGMYLDEAVVDEAADCPSEMIPTVLLPALSDRQGKLIQIGTVKGRGPFWQAYLRAVDDPDSYAGLFKPDDTNVIPQSELDYLLAQMGEDAYAQEMLCDPSAAVHGSYYAKTLQKHADQVLAVPLDAGLGVTIAMDLGIADSTAIWVAQIHRGGEIRLINFLEYQNTSFVQILGELREQYPNVTEWIGPHDLRVREYTSGISREDTARKLGIRFTIATRMPVIDGIEAVRRAIPRMFFDEKQCRDGLDRLALYRSDYDEKKRVLSRNPVHDWTSHAADAMRYLITGTSGGQQRDIFANTPIDYGEVGGD